MLIDFTFIYDLISNLNLKIRRFPSPQPHYKPMSKCGFGDLSSLPMIGLIIRLLISVLMVLIMTMVSFKCAGVAYYCKALRCFP